MGYVIKYAEDINQDLSACKKQNNKKFLLPIFIFILFVLLTPLRRWFYDSFIPENFEVASKEFSDMIAHIEQGESLTDAVTVFCQEIINYG